MQLAKMITPSLQTLKRIKLQGVIDNLSQDPLVGLCEELEDILGKNKLTYWQIVIARQVSNGTRWRRYCLNPEWSMLKHVFLVIVINIWYGTHIDSPFGMALKSLPQTQFAGLMSSKDLDIRFSVQEESLKQGFS